MPKYMVVVKMWNDDGTCDGTSALFFEDWMEAEDYRMNAEVGLGWYAEVYERQETEGGREYVFIYS